MLDIELLLQQNSQVNTLLLPGSFSQLAQAHGHLSNSKGSAHCIILLGTLLKLLLASPFFQILYLPFQHCLPKSHFQIIAQDIRELV